MDTLFVHLKKLYENELYDQVQPIVSKFIYSNCRKNTGIKHFHSKKKHLQFNQLNIFPFLNRVR